MVDETISFPLRDAQGNVLRDANGDLIWEYSMFISPGLKVNDITYNTGHNYTAEEIGVDYHFEARIENVHPTLINSASVITLVGDGETGSENADGCLTAYNDLKGGIDVRKTVVIPEGAIQSDPVVLNGSQFQIRVTMTHATNSLTTDEAANEGFGYRILYGPNNPAHGDPYIVDGVIQNYGRSDRFPITGGVATATIYDGDQLMVTNVPSGTQYIVEELSPEDIWIVTYTNQTGTVVANAANDAVVTNTLLLYKLQLLKVGDSNLANPLAGAVFELYADSDVENGAVKDGATPLATFAATDENGIAALDKLALGTYWLKETTAPDGYLLAGDLIKVIITKDSVSYEQTGTEIDTNGDGTAVLTDDADAKIGYQIAISDPSGSPLPLTGGPGTTAYTLGGLATLAAGMTLAVVLRRRRRSEA